MTLCDPPRFCFRRSLACEVCSAAVTATHRDQMIRLVVSQQWGVMMRIALLFDAQNHAKEVARKFLHGNEVTDAYWLGSDDTETEVVRTMMKIPCAVDVVDGLL